VDLNAFAEHLKWAEGVKQFPYRCTAGKLTIGVGRNLDDNGLTWDEVDYLLNTDIDRTIRDCERLDYWNSLDSVRQLIVADMVFNLGLARFLKFVNLNKALAIQDYTLAASEMMDSRWYNQVGRRAQKLREAMLSGEWNDG
jgi:lysozyme